MQCENDNISVTCPSLSDLPPPPGEKSGWPWTEVSDLLPEQMPDGSSWPKISIVTPSYNQGAYIEETIRSVLLQGYPNLEYIIIDGNSVDQTVEIIKKYETWIDYWVSESDRGQTHAINKGFSIATGDIVAWINSDDFYAVNAFCLVAKAFVAHPHDIILGDVEDFYNDGTRPVNRKRLHHVTTSIMLKPFDNAWCWHQPGTFVPMEIQNKVGLLDESLDYAFDKDWIFRLVEHAHVLYLGHVVSHFRIHFAAKTTTDKDKFIRELYQVNLRFLNKMDPQDAKYLRALYHIRLAGLYLIEHQGYAPYFNRYNGMLELIRGLSEKLSIIYSDSTLKLLLRAILPRFLWYSGKD